MIGLGLGIVRRRGLLSAGTTLVITSIPSITGVPDVGEVLTGDDGTATGEGVVSIVGRQWYRDGVAIPGATNTTYTTTASDNLTNVAYGVTYQDDNGTLSSRSTTILVGQEASGIGTMVIGSTFQIAA